MSGLPITFGALVVTLFLFPGIAFIAGLFSRPTVNRDASTLSAPITFALILFAACVINFLGGLALWFNVCSFGSSDAVCGPFSGTRFIESLTLGRTLLLVAASLGFSVVAVLLGQGFSKLVETGRLRTEILHGWAYDYIRDPGLKIAFVVVTVGKDMQRLGYEGTLHALRLGSDGSIHTVILKDVSRFRVDYSETGGEHRVRIDEPSDRNWSRTDLMIEGAKIENIAIRSLPSLSSFS